MSVMRTLIVAVSLVLCLWYALPTCARAEFEVGVPYAKKLKSMRAIEKGQTALVLL